MTISMSEESTQPDREEHGPKRLRAACQVSLTGARSFASPGDTRGRSRLLVVPRGSLLRGLAEKAGRSVCSLHSSKEGGAA